MRRWFGVLFSLMAIGVLAAQEPLWVIEQEFIKLGKQEVYENYKKEQIENAQFPVVALREVDEMQYIYLIPVNGFQGLADYFKQSQHHVLDKSLVNFTVESLQLYLEECSFIPEGKESYFDYPFVYFYVFTIDPGYDESMQNRLKTLRAQQKQSELPTCFRTWKVIMGADLPKYIVAVFCHTAKEGEDFDVITRDLKRVLRKESHGWAKVMKELSTVNGKKKL